MSRVNFQQGPVTYDVNVAVTAGRLVEPDAATGRIKHAAAGSVKVLGMARTNAQPAGSAPTGQIDASWAQPGVAVIYGPADVDLTYSGAATFGDLLVATADGQVGPAGATPAVGTIVARCTAEAGVAAGAVGRARLLV